MYNCDYFINKISNTPEDKFCIGNFWDFDGRHCVNGMCGLRSISDRTEESIALQKVFSVLTIHEFGNEVRDFKNYSQKGASINNGFAYEYQQPTVKQRLLAALYDAKQLWAVKEAETIIADESTHLLLSV